MTATAQDVGITTLQHPGGTLRLAVTVSQDGAVKDLTGASAIVYGLYGARPEDFGDGQALFTKTLGAGIALTAPVSGIFTVSIDPADTATIPPGDYFHQAVVTDSAGDIDNVLIGTLRLTATFP